MTLTAINTRSPAPPLSSAPFTPPPPAPAQSRRSAPQIADVLSLPQLTASHLALRPPPRRVRGGESQRCFGNVTISRSPHAHAGSNLDSFRRSSVASVGRSVGRSVARPRCRSPPTPLDLACCLLSPEAAARAPSLSLPREEETRRTEREEEAAEAYFAKIETERASAQRRAASAASSVFSSGLAAALSLGGAEPIRPEAWAAKAQCRCRTPQDCALARSNSEVRGE